MESVPPVSTASEEAPKQEETRIVYFIRHIQQLGPTTYKEFVNKYDDIKQVMERFDYWIKQTGTAGAMVVCSVVTSSVLAEWRRDEIWSGVTSSNNPTGDAADAALSSGDERGDKASEDGVSVSDAGVAVQDSTED